MNQKWEKNKESKTAQGVEAALTFYMEELSDVEELTKEEEERLFSDFIKGDSFAQKRYVEGNLKKVIKIAANYIGKGVPLGDLIQEGNMALLMAMDQFKGMDLMEWQKYMEDQVIASMEASLSKEQEEEDAAKKVADRANLLSEVSKNLAEELGREATAEEIADRLSTTVDDVKEMMKISLDALSVMTPEMENTDEMNEFEQEEFEG